MWAECCTCLFTVVCNEKERDGKCLDQIKDCFGYSGGVTSSVMCCLPPVQRQPQVFIQRHRKAK